jgi:hypothetical protein
MQSLCTSVKILDFAEARKYLAEVRFLADEGARSHDPRVTLLALKVLQEQPATIRRLLRKVA